MQWTAAAAFLKRNPLPLTARLCSDDTHPTIATADVVGPGHWRCYTYKHGVFLVESVRDLGSYCVVPEPGDSVTSSPLSILLPVGMIYRESKHRQPRLLPCGAVLPRGLHRLRISCVPNDRNEVVKAHIFQNCPGASHELLRWLPPSAHLSLWKRMLFRSIHSSVARFRHGSTRGWIWHQKAGDSSSAYPEPAIADPQLLAQLPRDANFDAPCA